MSRTVTFLRFLSLPLFFLCYAKELFYPSLFFYLFICWIGLLRGRPHLAHKKGDLLYNRILHLSLYLYFFDKSLIPFWLFITIYLRYLSELILIPFYHLFKKKDLTPAKSGLSFLALALSLFNILAITLAYHLKLWEVSKLIKYGPMIVGSLLEFFLFCRFLSHDGKRG